jgi:PAS domain-containing protein
LLDRYSPAAVLTNAQGDILYISGRTGKYLEPAAGKANWNIHAMAREGLRNELGGAFQKALRDRAAAGQIRVRLKDGGAVQHSWMSPSSHCTSRKHARDGDDRVRRCGLIPSDKPSGKRARIPAAEARLEQELAARARGDPIHARGNADVPGRAQIGQRGTAVHQRGAAEHERRADHVQGGDAVLNEELQTLNHELQAKVDDESRANDDMRNLLDSTDIATLFLDEALKVRRFTPCMTKIIKLIPGDLNRPITDLASDLIYPELASDAQTVLRTLVFKETPVKTVDARWFSVRIMPYRTLDNRIDGVVITFADITAAKTLEATLRQNQST